MSTPNEPGREQRFVTATIQRCQQDKGLAARLRRADNPATEYQAWEWLGLARFGVNLESVRDRLPYATVAAAIARTKPDADGNLPLGVAIARCYKDGNKDDQAIARLRRLLACGDIAELCRVLRPVLHLVESRVSQPLDYTALLRQLRHFGMAVQRGDEDWQQRIRARWAQAFYRTQPVGEEAQ